MFFLLKAIFLFLWEKHYIYNYAYFEENQFLHELLLLLPHLIKGINLFLIVAPSRIESSNTTTTLSLTASSITDIPNQFGYTNPNNPNSGFTSTQLSYTLTVPSPGVGETSSTVKYDAEGDCDAGLAKLDNKGDTDTRSFGTSTNTPQAARTNLNASDKTITGIYPYFWGVSSTEPTVSSIASIISSGNANKVLQSASGSFTITFDASSEFLWFAHFSNYSDKTTWYVDGNNNGIIGTQLFDNPQTQSVNSPDAYWTNINLG